MALSFNPALWFVCKSCREYFSDTDKFTAHKLENHLGEILKIKCIVFEEVLLHHDWIPPADNNSLSNNNQVSNVKKYHEQILHLTKNSSASTTQAERERSHSEKLSLHNPYVTLKVLTKQELESNLNKNSNSKLVGPKPNRGPCSSRRTFSQAQILSKPNELSVSENNGFKSKKIPIMASAESTFLSPPRCNFQSQSGFADAAPQSPSENTVDFDPEQYIETETPQFDLDDTLSNVKVEFIDFDPIAMTGTDAIKAPNFEIGSDTNPGKDTRFDTSAVLQKRPEAYRASKNSRRRRPTLATTTQSLNKTKKKPKRPKNCQCHICGLCSVSSYHLHMHMTTHSTPVRFNCPHCDIELKSRDTLQKHLVIHGKVTRYKCRFCEKFFASNRDLVGHESSHTGERPFKCDVGSCVLDFRTKTSLFLHTRDIHRKELGLPDFVCPTCGMTFGVASLLKSHMRKH